MSLSNEIVSLLDPLSTNDLFLVVRHIEAVINNRRAAERQELISEVHARLLPLSATVAALRVEFDSAQLPVQKRYIKVRLDAAVMAHDDVASQLDQLQYTFQEVKFFSGPARS